MKRYTLIGLIVGAAFGAGGSVFLWPVGLPGLLVGFFTGLVQPWGNRPGADLLYYVVNGAFYGAIGMGVGSMMDQNKNSQRSKRTIPECSICGYKCVSPTSARCEKCGAPTAFILWTGRKPGWVHCQRCGYDLTGNQSGMCPECGEPL